MHDSVTKIGNYIALFWSVIQESLYWGVGISTIYQVVCALNKGTSVNMLMYHTRRKCHKELQKNAHHMVAMGVQLVCQGVHAEVPPDFKHLCSH